MARGAGQGYNEAQHLYVKAAADIFFDTPSYNAHSSGCDVLWSGTPLLTGLKLAACPLALYPLLAHNRSIQKFGIRGWVCWV